MPKMRKITEVEFNTPVEKPEKIVDVMMYYSEKTAPERIKAMFTVPAANFIVTPLEYIETVIAILRGNNPQKKRYAYKAIPKGNTLVFAVQYDRPT